MCSYLIIVDKGHVEINGAYKKIYGETVGRLRFTTKYRVYSKLFNKSYDEMSNESCVMFFGGRERRYFARLFSDRW